MKPSLFDTVVGVARRGACAAALVFASAPASAWVAYNDMTTANDPSRAGVLEVFHYPRAWNIDYWCAAGDHVFRYMGLPQGTRIYLVRGPGPSRIQPGRKSAIFTVAPDEELVAAGEDRPGYSLSITKPGFNLTAAHGRARCRDSLRNLRGLPF